MPFQFQVPYTQGNDASSFNEGMQSAGGMVAQAIQNQLRQQQIQQAQIQNQYLPYSEQADIGAKLMQTQLMPMQTTAALYRGMGSYGGALNNYIANLQRYAQTPEGKQFLAQNPQAMKNYLSTLSNLSQNAPSAAGMGPAAINGVPSVNVGNVFGGLPPSLFPLLRPTNTQSSPTQAPVSSANNSSPNSTVSVAPTANNQNNVVAQNAALNPPVNMQQLPMTNAQIQTLKTLQSPSSPTPQNVQSAQDVASSDVIAKTVPKDIQKQRYYAQSVDNMLNQVAPIMPQITKFAGAVGKYGSTVDKYASAFNLQANDPDYQTFNNFINTQAPLISNEMRRAFGGQATDTEMKTMGNLANPIYWKSNPTLALSQFNSLVNTLKANDKALVQSQSQTLGGLNNAINSPPYAKPTSPIGPAVGNALGGGSKGVPSGIELLAELQKRGYKKV